MKNMAELPAEDGAAGQRQANGIGPKGEGPLLMVSAQNDALEGQGQVKARLKCGQSGVLRTASLTGPWHFLQFPKFSSTPSHNN